MRIVWKDTVNVRERKPIKYRRYVVSGLDNGWITNMSGDDNIYKSHYCAMNAIDKALGGRSQRSGDNVKRKRYGVEIVGKKNDIA